MDKFINLQTIIKVLDMLLLTPILMKKREKKTDDLLSSVIKCGGVISNKSRQEESCGAATAKTDRLSTHPLLINRQVGSLDRLFKSIDILHGMITVMAADIVDQNQHTDDFIGHICRHESALFLTG